MKTYLHYPLSFDPMNPDRDSVNAAVLTNEKPKPSNGFWQEFDSAKEAEDFKNNLLAVDF